MIARPLYMEKLLAFRDKQIIKIVTGIRRCGKSTLLDMFVKELLRSGVQEDQIITINFEDANFFDLDDHRKLHAFIEQRLRSGCMSYIILDEIQHVKSFERAIDSLYIKRNVDIYLTGSNAYLLSGEIATLLSGRYVEIHMLPLSFREFLSGMGEKVDPNRMFNQYLRLGSFPFTLELGRDDRLVRDYLEGIYNTVILKDVMARRKIADPFMLESVIRFMFDNVGNLCSIKHISDSLTSSGRSISTHTVATYLAALCESFILYRVGRFDVKGLQHLKTGEKYYLADMGLRYFLLGSKGTDLGRMLENVIFLELLRRGFHIYVGKVNGTEVDFVADHEDGRIYIQVAATVRDETTLARELQPLMGIADHSPKMILTLDDDPPSDYSGIRRFNALDWLRKEEM